MFDWKSLLGKLPGLGSVFGGAAKGVAGAVKDEARAVAAKHLAPHAGRAFSEMSDAERAEALADAKALVAYLETPNKRGRERNLKAGQAFAEIAVAVAWEIVD